MHQMPSNAQIAEMFETLARLSMVRGDNPFRVRAHEQAAAAVSAHPTPVAGLSRDDLVAIEGIGKGSADRIIEAVETGGMADLGAARRDIPESVLALFGVQGLGPKTILALWKELKVASLDDLRRVIDDGSILSLPRMGKKTVENIKQSLAFAASGTGRTRLGQALPLARALAGRLLETPGVTRLEIAGSLRRGQDTIGDIDLLAVATEPSALMDAFVNTPGVARVLAKGDTKASVLLATEADLGRWASGDDEPERAENTGPADEPGPTAADAAGPAVQVDLRVVPEDRFGAALHYFTGSKDHNIKLRQRALDRGMTLNDWGLFDEPPGSDRDRPPQDRGEQPIAAASEREIFEALHLPYIPPELRQGRGEFEHEATPALIEIGDIRAELHSHTTASDGSMEIAESARHAAARGFHTLAVTDHSRSSVIANGLSIDRLRAHAARIRETSEALRAEAGESAPVVLAGSEVDILADGTLDYPDDVLALLDVVVASPHAALSQDPASATKRLLRAIENPLVSVIGHPTGRLINRRRGLEPAMPEIVAAAAEHEVALEINAHWMRLDLRDAHVAIAVEAGCLIAIDCDVHGPGDYDNLEYGVLTARRGGLTAVSCVNCWDRERLLAWLGRNR